MAEQDASSLVGQFLLSQSGQFVQDELVESDSPIAKFRGEKASHRGIKSEYLPGCVGPINSDACLVPLRQLFDRFAGRGRPQRGIVLRQPQADIAARVPITKARILGPQVVIKPWFIQNGSIVQHLQPVEANVAA